MLIFRTAEMDQNEDKEKENLPACDLQSLREFLAVTLLFASFS